MDTKTTQVVTQLLIFSLLIGTFRCETCDLNVLRNSINLLQTIFEYFLTHLTELNIDGALAMRICADQLKTILKSKSISNAPAAVNLKLRNLMKLADKIAWSAQPFVLFNSNAEAVHLMHLLDPGTWNFDYNTRHIDASLMGPSSCSSSKFMENSSDACLAELLPSRFSGEPCRITDTCWKTITKPGSKDYALTHQLLYLQVAELHDCGSKSEWLRGANLRILQDIMCSNIYKDAVEISGANFPGSHRDLFLEQIGLCGMLGYIDFWRRDWLDVMENWQTQLGCFYHPRRWICIDNLKDYVELERNKREDIFTADGCSVHLSGVAALALTVDIKFCLRYLYPDIAYVTNSIMHRKSIDY